MGLHCQRLIVVAALSMVPALAAAGRADDPADGTVFIRLVGDVQALRGDDARLRREVLVELTDVLVASGSGFLVSPDGWVVTNLHVVTGEKRILTIGGEKVEVTVDIRRIEVVLPATAADPLPRRYPASISASDAELDLAILYLSAQGLPFVRLGDSDALTAGAAVRAFGFPFGGAAEIAKPDAAGGVVPEVSVSPGAVASLRRDAGGEVRYIQTTAPLNPGNSGGPVVDEDGYVVAVAQLELRDDQAGSGIGFGIPVNVVKRFMSRHGLDQRLPARMLTLGGSLDAPAKGIRLQVPAGFSDQSPYRLRVDSGASDPAIVLRIDRLASGQSPDQIEAPLYRDGLLDGLRASAPVRRRRRTAPARPSLDGFVRSVDGATGRDVFILHSIVDLGEEVIVARYIGLADAVALNRSSLEASLASLEAATLLTGVSPWAAATSWTTVAVGQARTALAVPRQWLIESGGASRCGAREDPAWGVTLSPAGDFTIQLRAAWHPGTGLDVEQAARACAPGAGSLGPASYSSRADWWGTTYEVEGVFAASPAGVWHLEVAAPVASSADARRLFARWVPAVLGAP